MLQKKWLQTTTSFRYIHSDIQVYNKSHIIRNFLTKYRKIIEISKHFSKKISPLFYYKFSTKKERDFLSLYFFFDPLDKGLYKTGDLTVI